MRKNVAIILAGGQGERFKGDIPKQFLKLSGKTVIEHTIDVFEKHELIDEIYIVVNSVYYYFVEEVLKNNKCVKVNKILNGGSSRQESSKIGLLACDNEEVDKVIIHEAIRPFITSKIISEIINKLDKYLAVDVAIPTADTIIKISAKRKVINSIPERRLLMRGQTPQGFKLKIIKKAHELADREGVIKSVDDCSLVLKYNLGDIYVVDGSTFNIKITYPEDIYLAEKLFQLRSLKMEDLINKRRLTELEGKNIIVFGGSSGIGKQICEIGEKYGAQVWSFSRQNGVDIANYKTVRKSLQKVYKVKGKIDIIICTAGTLKTGRIESISLSAIKEQVNTNFLGSLIVAKESIPYLKETKGSMVFFTSSSYMRGRENYAAYSSSKAAIVNFVQALSDELYRYGIRVNIICPERTDTPMRWSNFGKEPKETLLSPKTVAYFTLIAILSNVTGQVIDIRKTDENQLNKFVNK
jgi:2-C-methyl-D-erythritol 4-phosphate cytidylyltransferase